MALLTKDDILRGLREIDRQARAAAILIDLAVYGGAALVIAFDVNLATRDVDAVVRGSLDFVRAIAAKIALDEGWSPDWLNDGVKGFLSGNEDMEIIEAFPGSPEGGLRVFVPTPFYIFAMKCMAMRPDGIDGSHDIADIEFLAKKIGIQTSEAAFSIIEGFYPASRIPAKVRFGVEEIMERMNFQPNEALDRRGADRNPTD